MTQTQRSPKKIYIWVNEWPTGYTACDYVDTMATWSRTWAVLNTGVGIAENYLKLQFWVEFIFRNWSGQYFYNRAASPWLSAERYSGATYLNAWSSTWISWVQPSLTSNVYYVWDIEYNNGSISLDLNGTTYTGSYSGTIARTSQYYWENNFAFGGGLMSSSPGVTDNTRMHIYYLKMYTWSNFTLVRDFRPMTRNADSVAWLYDMVNNEFYTSANTWQPFIAWFINNA